MTFRLFILLLLLALGLVKLCGAEWSKEAKAHLAALQTKAMTPQIVLPPASWFFAATAGNRYGVSGYSNEVSGTNSRPTLAWNAVANCGVTGYTVWRGKASRSYMASFGSGTNTMLAIPSPEASLSNLVVMVTGPTGLVARVTNQFVGSHYWTGHSLTISAQRTN